MSIRIMTEVWQRSGCKGTDLLLLLALADFAGEDGVSWPSVATLAAKTRQTERAVQMQLRRLERRGELRIDTSPGGPGHSSVYTVNIIHPSGHETVNAGALTVNGGASNGEPPFTPNGERQRANGERRCANGERRFTRSVIDPSKDPSYEPSGGTATAPPLPAVENVENPSRLKTLALTWQAMTGRTATPQQARKLAQYQGAADLAGRQDLITDTIRYVGEQGPREPWPYFVRTVEGRLAGDGPQARAPPQAEAIDYLHEPFRRT